MPIKLTSDLRPTGIEIIGEATWGTHFCNFYETKQDMLDILVPFFRSGLQHNEYCVYITEANVTIEEAMNSLRTGIPDIDSVLLNKKIEIITHKDWYLKKGSFNADEIFQCWDDKLEYAISSGFEGLRINGNAAWLERNIWDTFIEYESALNEHIGDKKIIIMCTYPLEKCVASDVLDVAQAHNSAIAKRRGKWELFETPDTKRTKAQILKKNEQLKDRIIIGTQQLKEINLEFENIIEEQAITEEELDISEATLKSIFDNSDTGLILLDSKMNIVLFNNIANQIAIRSFGRGYIHAESMFELIRGEQKAEYKTNFDIVLAGKQINLEHSYVAPDSTVQWFYTRMFPIKTEDGRNIGVCISTEDITIRKNIEIEKEKVTVDLLHRNKDLEQFSYMVSHNLRAPVANIMGFSQLLLGAEHPPEEKEIFGKQINSSAHILDEVIRDMNLILKIKTEIILKSEIVWFSAIIENIKKTIQHIIENENVVIETDFTAAETITGNRVYLYSIFLNLISNSIKYHQPGIAPVIKVSTEINNGKLLIRFRDNGLGIDLNKYADKVFGLYKRFHAEIEGKGMGLFMVKSQVELLGGKISVDSSVNNGTIFTIELNQ